MKEIKDTLQALFPQLIIEKISNLGVGNDCNAVLINESIVFKIPKHQKASDNLMREKLILDLIQGKVSLPIPNIEHSAILPNGFIVVGYSKINGETFTKEIFDTLSEQEKNKIAKEFAQFLKELHQIEIISNDLAIDKKKKIELDYKVFISKFSSYFSLEQLAKVKSFFEQVINDNSLYSYKPTLVHNDFSAENILFDETTKTISAIIDFGDVAITDRDNDFLCLLENSDEEYGSDFGISVLKYYGLGNDEIELAIKKTEINDTMYPYELMLLSDEYNDKSMFDEGLNKIKSY